MEINIKDNYFDYVRNNTECKVILYGAGVLARANYKLLGRIDYFCDQKAKSIKNIGGTPCLLPEELKNFDKKIIILICVCDKLVAEEICSVIEGLKINAEVFQFENNPAFYWASPDSKLLPILPVLKGKISENGHVNIADIGIYGENYISFTKNFGRKNMQYHVIKLNGQECAADDEWQAEGKYYFHESVKNGERWLDTEAVNVLKNSDACLFTEPVWGVSYHDLLEEVIKSGVEYIFIARALVCSMDKMNGLQGQISEIVLDHDKLNERMRDFGYRICFDLFQGTSKLLGETEYRSFLYQAGKS